MPEHPYPVSAQRDPPFVEQRPQPDVVKWTHQDTGLEAELHKRRYPASPDPRVNQYDEWQAFAVRDDGAVVYTDEFRELSFDEAVYEAREWLQEHVDGSVQGVTRTGAEVLSGR